MEVNFRGMLDGLLRRDRVRQDDERVEDLRSIDRKTDAMQAVRRDDLRPSDAPKDAVLVLQKSMELRRDDIADEEKRAERRREE